MPTNINQPTNQPSPTQGDYSMKALLMTLMLWFLNRYMYRKKESEREREREREILLLIQTKNHFLPIAFKKTWMLLFCPQLCVGQAEISSFGKTTDLREEKILNLKREKVSLENMRHTDAPLFSYQLIEKVCLIQHKPSTLWINQQCWWFAKLWIN